MEQHKRYEKPMREIHSVEDVLQLEQSGSFYDELASIEHEAGAPFEMIPFPEKEEVLLNRLRTLVQVIKVNPIWNDRLQQAGVTDITSWEDWQRVPITTRAELNEGYTTSKNMLVIPFEHGGYMPVSSGGSSGKPIISLYRLSEMQDICKRAGQFWRRNLMEQDEIVTFLNMMGNTNGWSSHSLAQFVFNQFDGASVIASGELTSAPIADFWLQQGVTDIAGIPSDFSKLLPHLGKNQYENVKRLLYGGEFMDPFLADKLQQTFPKATLTGIYASTQAYLMGIQVNGEFRLHDDINYLEIVDEQDKPVPYGTPGRIIVTRLMGNGSQPLRMDIQDTGTMLLPEEHDPLQARKLLLKGRTGEELSISSYRIPVDNLLRTSHLQLSAVLPDLPIHARQFIVDQQGLHLYLAVDEPQHVGELDPILQEQILKRAIVQAGDFFAGEDGAMPQDWIEGTGLTIHFVTPNELQKTPVGKVHPYINNR